MKGRHARLALMAVTLGALGLGFAQTAEGVDFRGKGTVNPGHCKPCFPEPAGCAFFECDNHFCNYTCTAPDGSTYSYTTSRQG